MCRLEVGGKFSLKHTLDLQVHLDISSLKIKGKVPGGGVT